MAKPTGFLEYRRSNLPKRPVEDRTHDYREIEQLVAAEQVEMQAARCMDCGIPFCHACGCPLGNIIPEFNDLIYRKQWKAALEVLHSTNNFPEFTGRICPAPCEAACTLSLNDQSVSIRQLELHLVERGWQEGWIKPQPAIRHTGRKVAVIGSGPAGLAAAQQLIRLGHAVTVFDAADKVGGILRYGIPDFKLEKWILDRRLEQLRAEGVIFETKVKVGNDLSIHYLRRSFDAILLAAGARIPRDLEVPGRQLKGVHFAMDYLIQQNRRVAGEQIPEAEAITATGRRTIIIGGGDTGADCLGTALRQGAIEVLQFEILPKPPESRDESTPWPAWPNMLRSSSSHEEGGKRRWTVLTKELVGQAGAVCGLRGIEVEWRRDPVTARHSFVEKPGTEFEISAELILLAMGFTLEGNKQVLHDFGIMTTATGSALMDANGMTNVPGVFVAGDLAKGASLVVRAISDGRTIAAGINRYLKI